MKDRIKELLGRGIPAINVANAVGCDESYVSQLMSEEAFAAEVRNLKATNFEKHTQVDDDIDAAEAAALAKVKQMIPFISRPGEAAACFRILNAARRRVADGAAVAQQQPSTIVNITIPQVARVAMVADHNRQVIEVDGRPLVTMPAKQLVGMSEAARATRLLEAQVPKMFSISQTKLSEKL